jgi:hypothetical protein
MVGFRSNSSAAMNDVRAGYLIGPIFACCCLDIRRAWHALALLDGYQAVCL